MGANWTCERQATMQQLARGYIDRIAIIQCRVLAYGRAISFLLIVLLIFLFLTLITSFFIFLWLFLLVAIVVFALFIWQAADTSYDTIYELDMLNNQIIGQLLLAVPDRMDGNVFYNMVTSSGTNIIENYNIAIS